MWCCPRRTTGKADQGGRCTPVRALLDHRKPHGGLRFLLLDLRKRRQRGGSSAEQRDAGGAAGDAGSAAARPGGVGDDAAGVHRVAAISEERRVGKVCVRTCSTRWLSSH